MKFWVLAILGCTGAYWASAGADARDAALQRSAYAGQHEMPVHGLADAPIGHVQFCADYPADCRSDSFDDLPVILTMQRWNELERVNSEINLAIKPMSDQSQYGTIEKWTYPTSGKGDCEDYVLLKKKRLIALGWPASDLLITVVRDENNEGHAILTVRTHRGDLVLDNKHSRIVAWNLTPYIFIKRQSALDPRRWESLVPLRTGPTVASAGADAKR
ncbi:MAG: transglutaminase-like cysteine peptidase [Rhodomicrobium sp.]|nr:transglutaminase-like cysteine peptidase [Rhodomicrobium sp.]